MNTEDLLQILKEIGVLADIAGLNYDKPLQDQGVDSLDMANIFLNILEKYGVNVPIEEGESLSSINKIVNFVNNAKKA